MRLVRARSLQYVAPVLVLSGSPGCSSAWRPGRPSLAWLPLVLAVVVMLFGAVLRLPQWLQDLSPFEHLALVPAQDFRWQPFVWCCAAAAALSVAGQVAFRTPRRPLNRPFLCFDEPMWQPEPGWHPLPGGAGASTVGVWRTVLGDQPVVVKRLGGSPGARPGRAQRPAALRLLAPRRPTWSPPASSPTHPGLRAARADGRRGGRRGHHADPGVGGGRRQQRAVRGARAGPVRRRRPRATEPWLATDQLRDRMDRVDRRGGWPTLARTTVADVADHLWQRRAALLDAARRAAAGAAARRPDAGQPARPRGRRRGRGRLGHARPRPGRRRPRLLPARPRARSSSRCSTPTCSACPTGSPPATRWPSAPG